MTTSPPHLDAASLPDSIRHAVADIQNLLTLAAEIHGALPNIPAIAKNNMRQKVRQRTGADLDPDTLWLHTFTDAQSSSESFSGWQHNGPPRTSQTLSTALRHNFDASWQDATPDDVNQQAGIYHVGPSATHFGVDNEVRYLASDLRDDIFAIDLQSQVSHANERFWARHKAGWRTLVKADLVRQARKALMESTLSEQGYRLAMRCGAPTVSLNGQATFEQFTESSAPGPGAEIYSFDLNGYPSSDIRRLVAGDGYRVIYLPGERLPFREFPHESALQKWVIAQAANPRASDALASHFSLYNRQDGTWRTGIDHTLRRLASGQWRLSDNAINSHSERLPGDLFDDMANATQRRSMSDIDTLVQSDAEVRTEMLRRYLGIVNSVFNPMLGVLDPLMGMLGELAFSAELGIEAYQTSTADDYVKRQRALTELTENCALYLPLLFGTVVRSTHALGSARPSQHWYWPERAAEAIPASRTPLDNTVHLSEPEQYLESLFAQRNNMRGMRVDIANVNELKSYDFVVPDTTYRAHTNPEAPGAGLNRAPGSAAPGDDYLAAIIKHTARTGGSGGEVMSLTKDGAQALTFSLQYLAHERVAPVYVIDTTQDRQAFRTIADILLHDAPRLLRAKKITAATFFCAADKLSLMENEIFYVKGNIPGGYVRLLKPDIG